MGSWYIFDLGQSCACQACPEEPADATGHLRGSQETAPKEIPSQENHETEPKPAEKPDAAEHTKDTEGTETKLSLKSLKIAPSTENEDKWEGASVSGSNMLYCILLQFEDSCPLSLILPTSSDFLIFLIILPTSFFILYSSPLSLYRWASAQATFLAESKV